MGEHEDTPETETFVGSIFVILVIVLVVVFVRRIMG